MTTSMSSMWMPRAATSVATSTWSLPSVKSLERLLALALAQVAVDGGGVDALLRRARGASRSAHALGAA